MSQNPFMIQVEFKKSTSKGCALEFVAFFLVSREVLTRVQIPAGAPHYGPIAYRVRAKHGVLEGDNL